MAPLLPKFLHQFFNFTQTLLLFTAKTKSNHIIPLLFDRGIFALLLYLIHCDIIGKSKCFIWEWLKIAKLRSSNFELLRIIAMVLIVFYDFFLSPFTNLFSQRLEQQIYKQMLIIMLYVSRLLHNSFNSEQHSGIVCKL